MSITDKYTSAYIQKKWKNKHSRKYASRFRRLCYGDGYGTDEGKAERIRLDKIKKRDMKKYANDVIEAGLIHDSDWYYDPIVLNGLELYSENEWPEQFKPKYEYKHEIEIITDHDWQCQNCKYINIKAQLFCQHCNTLNNDKDDEDQYLKNNIIFTQQSSKKYQKRKQNRKRKRKLLNSNKNNFERYWNEAKQHKDELKVLAMKHRMIRDKLEYERGYIKPLNFKVLITTYDCYLPKNNKWGELLYSKQLPIQHSDIITLYIFYDKDGDPNNFESVNYNTRFKGRYENSFLQPWIMSELKRRQQKRDSQKDSQAQRLVKKWLNEREQTMQQYIISKINKRREFLYLHDPDFSPKQIEHNDGKKVMDIQMIIKLEQFVGVEHEYTKDVTINNDLCYENAQFKLKNFTLTECCVDMIDKSKDEKKSFVLIPKGDEQIIYIPVHVAKNENINKAIDAKQEYMHYGTRLKEFATKCVDRLINRNRENIISGYSNQIQDRKLIKFNYGDCHDPCCNLLPLTCDLNRVLNDYMPYYDVLKDFIISYIGYDVIYYVYLQANNVQYIDYKDIGQLDEDDGSIVGFFGQFKGFEEPDTIDDKKQEKVRLRRAGYNVDDDSSSESIGHVGVRLFGGWSSSSSY